MVVSAAGGAGAGEGCACAIAEAAGGFWIIAAAPPWLWVAERKVEFLFLVLDLKKIRKSYLL